MRSSCTAELHFGIKSLTSLYQNSCYNKANLKDGPVYILQYLHRSFWTVWISNIQLSIKTSLTKGKNMKLEPNSTQARPSEFDNMDRIPIPVWLPRESPTVPKYRTQAQWYTTFPGLTICHPSWPQLAIQQVILLEGQLLALVIVFYGQPTTNGYNSLAHLNINATISLIFPLPFRILQAKDFSKLPKGY